MHIFIPSKGRPKTKTARTLDKCGVKYTIFVEPQDEGAYMASSTASSTARLVVIDKNDMGIGYVRNQILEYARENGIAWFWMLDDDITGFFSYSKEEGKLVKADAGKVLQEALSESLTIPSLLIAGLDFRQFAWSHKGKSIEDTQVCACVLINVGEGWPLKYPEHLMEDRAICLDVISAGYKTIRYTKWAFNTPPMGKGDGGCQTINNRRAEMKRAVDGLLNKYGRNIIKPVYKDKLGWWDCRINWKAVRGIQ